MAKRRKCVRCDKNRDPKFFTSERGRVCSFCRRNTRRRSSKNVRLQNTYGITEREYKEMYDSTNGRCWICDGWRRVLNVDHCHATERTLIAAGWEPLAAARASVRGLLCRLCNGRMLPAAKDRPERLRKAADYLERLPAQEFLDP